MNIRNKTLIVIVSTFICLITILYLVSKMILMAGFIDLEKMTVYQNVEKAINSMQDDYLSVSAITGDWAPWDETYNFVQTLDENYINDNFQASTFLNLRINLIVILNSSGKVVFSRGFDLESSNEIPVPEDLNNFLHYDSPLLKLPDVKSNVLGIIMLNNIPVIISSRPILKNDWKGPINGTLIMGRFLDDAELNRLRNITFLSLKIYNFYDFNLPVDVQEGRNYFYEQKGIFIKNIDEDYIAGYAMLKDIYGQPAIILKIDMARKIYHQGEKSLFYFAIFLLIVTIMFVIVTMLLLEIVILSRLYLLSKSVDNINFLKNLSIKKLLPGQDEISTLACAIDNMLDRIELSVEQLRHADRLAIIGQFASGIAHELNEPIGNILGFAELARKHPSLPAETHEDLEKIENASLYAGEIVKKLLLFSRQMPAKKTTVNINQIIKESLYFFEGRCKKNNIDLIIDMAQDITSITADISQMTQILVNLVSNAIFAMPHGGKLTIKTCSTENYILLIVEDTGTGIAEDVKEKIFNPFFTTKDINEGTGLGLSVVHGIVTSHGGTIKVDSIVGKGTKFEIQIPLDDKNEV